ncbi:glycosyltransferase [Wenzhouxiangella marina]|uniref:sucrose-phosphate synthase n=1 Tax=Wenzhouxiangella marina TaxID=1579979 RepID=A0A0K0XU24_9GAMM|nr:glycosyltransferase [Wenzhouxiangella marina]AKS41126.1 Sucrose-phosphate synthase [Wenzhouxiangella marina]MBB6088005.1 sucrose-phosphate synthase [Wenzhouxiangella marina]
MSLRIAFLNPQGNFDADNSHLTEHPDFGGQLIYVRELALAMARQGVTVDILTRQIIDPDWPEFAGRDEDFGELGEQVRILRLPFGGPGFLAKEALWPVLPDYVEAIRAHYGNTLPDYFTAHYADGGYAAVLLRAVTGLGFTFTGHSLGAQKMDKLKVSPDTLARLDARFQFSRRIDAERLAMQLADRVVTSTRAEAEEQYAHPLYRGAAPSAFDGFAVIPPGINGQIFHPDLGRDDPDEVEALNSRLIGPQVIVSSRLDAKKNIAGVVEAFARSPRLAERAGLVICIRGIDDPWAQLAGLGDDERAVLGPILARIDEAGLRDRVRFLNIGSQQALARTYRVLAAKGSVFALPSLVEPFGLAPIEAAACGLAVAATCNGGPSEVFGQGEGLLFDPEDPADIATVLQEALKRQGELQARALERIVPRYTWDRTAERYLEVIEAGIRTGRDAIDAPAPLDARERIERWLGMR